MQPRARHGGSGGPDEDGAAPSPSRQAGARERGPPDATAARWSIEDYRTSQAEYPGSIFAIAVTEDARIDFFTHRPYERYFNISHEDLSPMFFEATVRGRLEEDEEKKPVLILKSPAERPRLLRVQGGG